MRSQEPGASSQQPANRCQRALRLLLLCSCLWLLAPSSWLLASAAELIDRIAVTIENSVITESEVLREIRLTALQNGTQPDFGPARRREAANRLIEQELIRREMELNRYQVSDRAAVEGMLATLRQERGGAAAFPKVLATYQVTEAEVRAFLERQDRLLRFLDIRFRPAIQVPDADVQQYYEQTFVPNWRKSSAKPAPSLAESRDDIERILSADLVDRALDRWLGETRTQTRIRTVESVFR